ncbi:Crp/Fnr family transcriptional regulator [Aquimarina sp. AU474]|uniref:Crp/Fnr family transcriptional regulator n=1 Tax=Aquimarina sp. AU474 TaxID=2108529 RepID=UPI000D68E6A2|nr:Crp/Fnr family transcriptional regulator [Aquimarina sp. AU474]
MITFISYIQQYVSISDEIKKEISDLILIENISKGDILLEEGKICKRIYFIEKGTLRTYFYQKGKDITYWIYPDNSMVTSWHSYLSCKPSSEYIQATEDSIVCSLTYTQWQELYTKYPILERFGRLILEEVIALIDDFYKGYYFMSSKEKYELLVSVFPDITQRANLGHIASMIGISQETLSRIRSN